MRKRILRNWGLKLISVLIALVLWFVVVEIDDPADTRTFSNIPVTLINTEVLEQENKVYDVLGSTDTVRVTVEAPTSVIEQIRATDIVAEADMNKLTEINTIAISYRIQNVDVDVNRITGSHDVVRLNVEDRRSKWVSVQTNTTGSVAEGYIIYSVNPDQTRIEVSGPESAVAQVSYVGVEVDVSGTNRDVSANVDTVLYDAEGNRLELPSIVKGADSVHVDVEVLATKEVPIEVNTMGEPAEGYLATGVVEADTATVMIAGRSALLANISKITIPEEDLDITDRTENLVKSIRLRDYLPENVVLADSSASGRVVVTVYVEPIVEKTLTIPESNISLLNLPEDLEWQFAEDAEPYLLTISGLNAAVSGVQLSAVRGVVDIEQWMSELGMEQLAPGTYEIPMHIELPEDVSIDNEIIIKVNISVVEELEEEEW